jgi:hypothetical protein
MLSSLLLKRPTNYNYNHRNLKEYCVNSTKESIQKITEKNNLEKKNVNIINPLDKDNFIYHSIFVFLSLTIYTFTFYKRTQ